MHRPLWTVLVNQRIVAVVVANGVDEAWSVVSALSDYGDVAVGSETIRVLPCRPKPAATILRRARAAAVAHRFIACVRGRQFFTYLGRLPRPGLPVPVAVM